MNNRIISCWLSFAVVMLIGFNAAAMESSSAQSGYRIGPNDVIRIQVFGEPTEAILETLRRQAGSGPRLPV